MYTFSIATLTSFLVTCAGNSQFTPQTEISIDETNFRINDRITYEEYKPEAQGRLMNVRMVNSVFDDENPKTRPKDFDPEVNTNNFIESMEEYKSKGILAFTINLQGGFPGYEEAINTAFRPDASLKEGYMNRVSRVIEASDKLEMFIIVGFFYQRQDQILPDEDAVRTATAKAAKWLKEKGYTNVMVEIANEYVHRGFAHSIIKEEDGEVELMNIVRSNAPSLLVSTSGIGNGLFHPKVAEAADFILIHGNGCNPDEYESKVGVLKSYDKPIVFNEDWCFSNDPRGIGDAVEKAKAAFEAGASWGIMNQKRNQQYPFIFGIGEPKEGGNAEEDFIAYETIAKLVGVD